jgi:nitrogen fixation/metabolism regulation signal transduction histidine kinase
MGFSKFSITIIIRVILIVANCFFLISEYLIREHIISFINLGVLLLIQTFLLIRHIRRANLKIVEYFDLIKNRESAFKLNNDQSENSFSKIRKKINETNEIIQDIQIEKEIQTNYLNHIVNHINIGLFSFDENGKIKFINPEAKRILGVSTVFKIADLEKVDTRFVELLQNIQAGQQEIIELKESSQKLSINCGLLNLRNEKNKLISFHDIDKHLYQNEIESWNKLIRILNHEIMNSITPITSLSKTIKKYFFDGNNLKEPENLQSKTISRTVEGLDIIEERGSGLIHFVENYRKLSSLPKPKKSSFSVESLFYHIINLFQQNFSDNNIRVDFNITPKNLILKADKDQITQTLINLVKNSLESLKTSENPTLRLKAFPDGNNKVCLSVEDNGNGIPKEIIDDIFIPFYTTKESGSGIGLSLSKQIMKLHDGTIKVVSRPNISTEFTLAFDVKDT